MRHLSLLLGCLSVAFASGAGRQGDIKPVAKVTHPFIEEMSGIVKSRRFSNTYWVHNDSGDEARIFAIRQDGSLSAPTPNDGATYGGIRIRSARNVDWEDIATDGKDLIISDLGNNGNARRDLAIYVIAEPNPLKTGSVESALRIPVHYADQKAFPPAARTFDCEAIFVLRGKIYALTKHRVNAFMPATGTNLYRLDTRRLDKPNVLVKIDGAADLGGWVTAADVSPDGRTLAVLTHAPAQSVWLFSTRVAGDKFLSKGRGRQITFRGAQQCEAICWADAKTLMITNEQREIFRIAL